MTPHLPQGGFLNPNSPVATPLLIKTQQLNHALYVKDRTKWLKFVHQMLRTRSCR